MFKNIVIIFLLSLAVVSLVPESFARPQYLTNLTAVYGSGSCGTCHVVAGGMRDFNGTFAQHNGSYMPRNRTERPNGTFRQRNSSRPMPLNSYGILFANQPDHATDPSAALVAIGGPSEDTQTSTAAQSGPKAAPGFEIAVSVVGLLACGYLTRRRKR